MIICYTSNRKPIELDSMLGEAVTLSIDDPPPVPPVAFVLHPKNKELLYSLTPFPLLPLPHLWVKNTDWGQWLYGFGYLFISFWDYCELRWPL